MNLNLVGEIIKSKIEANHVDGLLCVSLINNFNKKILIWN